MKHNKTVFVLALLVCLFSCFMLMGCKGKEEKEEDDCASYVAPRVVVEVQGGSDPQKEGNVCLECAFGIYQPGMTHKYPVEGGGWNRDWLYLYNTYAEEKDTRIADVRLKIFVSSEEELIYDALHFALEHPELVETNMSEACNAYMREQFGPYFRDDASFAYRKDLITEIGEFTNYYDRSTQAESAEFQYTPKYNPYLGLVGGVTTVCDVPAATFNEDNCVYIWLVESVSYENGEEFLGYTVASARVAREENGNVPRQCAFGPGMGVPGDGYPMETRRYEKIVYEE